MTEASKQRDEEIKFPYDQKQIYEQGIVFFAKESIYHYQDVTEPNLFPHAYGMYVSKDKLDFERAENKKLREALGKVLNPGLPSEATMLELYSEMQKVAFCTLKALSSGGE